MDGKVRTVWKRMQSVVTRAEVHFEVDKEERKSAKLGVLLLSTGKAVVGVVACVNSMAQTYPFEKKLKLVVLGDSCVGKTSLLFAYTGNRLLENYTATVLENWAVTVSIDQKQYTVNLFDTAGQEDYAHIRCLSYPQTDVFLMCFSLVDPKTLESCKVVWLPEIRKYVGSQTPIVLVGTKEDLVESTPPSEKVDPVTAQQVADSIGAVSFVQCSSLTLRGVKRVFDESLLAAIGRSPLEPERKPCCCIG
ncbi:unnamed protein product [Toxocara canis]|nr:unnamed protein product [Toxocara canis]